jgi:putative ABC transport system ATP-binding protein
MPLIAAEAISKDYASEAGVVPVLRGVSVTIEAGEFLAIMGPSGSGKSTLMNILGLLDSPSSGRLTFAGEDVTRLDPEAQAEIRNARVGFVFQSYNLLARSTALENVELPLIYAGLGKREREARAREMLEVVGLGHRMRHWPTQLSGGEQQRVAIARAMATKPALVLADEPTGALDSRSGEAVLRHFQDLNAQGAAVVLVTHDEAVARYARRVLRLADGQIVSNSEVAARRAYPPPRRVDKPVEARLKP